MTGEDGRAHWEPPGTDTGAVVFSATCVAEEPAVAVLEAITAEGVVVRAWSVSSGRARPRTAVHVTATPASG
ncbi:hypothetical protein ABZ543_08005 [Streptomyces roseifaciens]